MDARSDPDDQLRLHRALDSLPIRRVVLSRGKRHGIADVS